VRCLFLWYYCRTLPLKHLLVRAKVNKNVMDQDRKMFSGNWTCVKCNGAITELPFEPRDTSNLMCRECHRNSRGDRPQRNDRRERRTFTGNWSCSDCGTDINELPFEPRDTSNLKCKDCFKKDKGF